MSGGEILLVAIAILVPLTIAVIVTLWTLQPAVLRNERAKRARRANRSIPSAAPEPVAEEPDSRAG